MSKQQLTDQEEDAKKLILEQNIDFYHEYMYEVRYKFSQKEPKEQAKMMAIYHAIEPVWVALLNLKKVIEADI